MPRLMRQAGWVTSLLALASLALTSIERAEAQIVATSKPVHALVALVMGATGTPELLVGGAASPHTYALKPSDAQKIAGAQVVFRIAESVEPFTVRLQRQLPKSAELVTLGSTPALSQLPRRAGGPFETHSHASGHKGHDHRHDEKGAKAAADGHVWLDPSNAAVMLDVIASTLAAKAPQHAAAYKANAATAKARLEGVANDIASELAPVAGKPFIVFHDATQYFEKRFNLTVAGSITTDPDVPASGSRLSALRAKIASTGAVCVFSEPNFENKVVASVIEGSKARTGVLDPEGVLLAPGPDLYEALLRGMARSIRTCLTP